MSTEKTSEQIIQEYPIAAVKPEQVLKVYSGKPGCGCGCNGSYRVNPLLVREANAETGRAYDADEINFTQVKRILKIVQGRAGEIQAQETENLRIYAVEDQVRYYWVYVWKEAL
jgi:hypothetical protein